MTRARVVDQRERRLRATAVDPEIKGHSYPRLRIG